MTEFATATMDWTYMGWDSPFTDDEPSNLTYEYVVDPNPLPDSWFDEGDGD
jgi:hypothetical protein